MAPKPAKRTAAPASSSPTPPSFPASAVAPTSGMPSGAVGPTPTKHTSSTSTSSTSALGQKNLKNSTDAQQILQSVWQNYLDKTPQRTKLLDVFLGFLVVVAGLQFVYCVIVGNYPFNAFLSGFSATVGQFVLTCSLRMQTNPENKTEFESISNERAFADFVFGSLLLHFFCVNFIN